MTKEKRIRQYMAVLLCLSVLLGCARSPAMAADGATHAKTPREAAERVRQRARMVRDRSLPHAPTAPSAREGAYLFVSWSIPDHELKTLMRQAHAFGATVVFRGMVEESWRKTVERMKAVALELREQTPATTIDPILFRTVGVTAVPAFALVHGADALLVTGSGSLRQWLTVMGREDGRVKPLREWWEQRERGWSQGGPTTEARPVLPALSGVRALATDLPRYAIAERDLEEVMRERIAQVNWPKVRQDFEGRVKRKLHDGPNIALPTTTEARQFTVDMTVTYDHDITEPTSGTIVVKAGTRINPALSVTYRQRLVVINGTDPQQVLFAKKYVRERGKEHVKVLLAAGDVAQVSEIVADRAYWLPGEMVARFQLAHVPSVISQRGPVMLVEEVVP